MCYNVEMKGADYSGNKSVGETYDDCVPWAEAATCEDFPFDGVAGVSLLLSEDKCRNPGGALLQPWCYTYVRDHRCHKRYCDVCNLYTAVDVIKNCAALQASNPDLCTSGIERYGCSKFCGLSLETYQRAHCPVPDLPSDTVVAGEKRSTYYQGESIKISCRSSGDVLHELTCSKDGWSGLPFTCNGCPLGWTEHGDRCYKYIATSATRREAEKICKSFDPTGTLFEIRSLDDQTAIRTMRNSNKDYQTGNWVSGELRSEYGLWLFDTGDPMVYFNWSTAAETTSLSYNCVELIAETQAHNEQGGWRTTSCDGTNMAPFICQVDNLKSTGCNDRIRTCPGAMAKFPDFCLHSGFQKTAYENCRRSCGLCRDKSFAQCFDPNNGTTYVRTSSASAVNVGYVMSFACKPGFYQTGGDLRRVCSSDGHLLGAEPVCETTPRAVDLKADKIRRRKETLAKNIAILLDHEGYRIPFDGKLTSWYYYCNTEGQLDFFVMRKTGSTYQYIGSNSLRCQPNWVMSYRVPTAEQISVLKSDVFGAFSINATLLSITDCDSASVKMLQLPAMNVTSLHDLQDSSRPLFSGQKCAVPSLGVRVEP
ncbi:kremen protein 2 [Biomphalaria glabrata]|nr:kremen protein 2 [Biomphalaria glabrata]